jgi:hypothetical protein
VWACAPLHTCEPRLTLRWEAALASESPHRQRVCRERPAEKGPPGRGHSKASTGPRPLGESAGRTACLLCATTASGASAQTSKQVGSNWSGYAVTGQEVTIRVNDLTSGSSRVINRSMSDPDRSSAEWIAEAPSTCSSSGICLAFPLTDFASVSFSDASATTIYGHTGSIGDPDYSPTELELRSDRHRLRGARAQAAVSLAGAEPSLLSAAGDRFSVTWRENTLAGDEASPPSFPGAGAPPLAGSQVVLRGPGVGAIRPSQASATNA